MTTAILTFPTPTVKTVSGTARYGTGGESVPERLQENGLTTPSGDTVNEPSSATRTDTRVLSPEFLAERGLVISAQAGNEAAFAGLVQRHQRRAYAVARSIVLTHDDAEDAVQEGFLHAWRALERFRPEQAFGAWLHRIVANAALDIARRKKVRDADELSESVSSPFHDPAVRAELRHRLGSAMSQLPERQRAVLVLHDVEGYKHSEIGQILTIPEGTARSDLHHARASLRKLLSNLRRDK